MLYTRKEILKKYNSTYQINKALENKEIFKFHLATKRNNIRYRDEDIRQYFVEENLFEFGKTTLNVENVEINIYDRERMLIELLRKKAQIPFDFYKEIISNYRKIANDLDSFKISECISYYKNEEILYARVQSEVY